MSGMVNPRPYTAPIREREVKSEPQTPKTMSEKLGQLGKGDYSTVKVDEHGNFTEGSFGMKMRSGLNAFGIGKPMDDIKSNRETLNNVMQQLYDEAYKTVEDQNQKWKEEGKGKNWHINPEVFAQKIMDSVYNQKTFLYGDSTFLGKTDPGYTIEQRIDRGTYLSSDLAGQIKDRFDYVLRNSIDKTTGNFVIRDQKYEQARRDEANRRGENLERLGPTNQDSVKRFFGQEVKNDGIISTLVNTGAGIIDGIKSTFDKLTGTETRHTAFERTLVQLREQGIKNHPPSDTKFWDAFEEYWTRAMTAPENSVEGMEFAYVQKKLEQYANNVARNGKVLDEKMVGEMTAKIITHGTLIGRIGDLRNHNYISGAKIEDIAKAIEVWRDQQPDDVKMQISQNDCEWLAGQILKSKEGERLMTERAPNFLTGFTDWASNFTSFDKKYDKFGSSPVLGRIYDEIANNYEKQDQPYFMQFSERTKHYLHKYDDQPVNQLKGWFEYTNPPESGPKELAGLFGESIKEVLIDRHKRIEQMMPELRENRESREILQDNLELFPLLKAQGNRFFEHPEVLKHNPTKPSEFVRSIVSDPVIYARTYAEMHKQVQLGKWKLDLPPEPPAPKQGASREELDKYQQDKRQYERLVGDEYGRFMRENVVLVRELARDIQDANQGKFEVLDEVQQTFEELRNVDVKSLRQNPEQMLEFTRKLDELRFKAEEMWRFSFNLINDGRRNMQMTDDEAKAVLGAVMGSWCDIDALLNSVELEAGRAQYEIGQLLETPKLETGNKMLGETETNLRHALEDSLKALESGDRKKMELTSDELKRQLVSAYETGFELFTAPGGTDEAQARKLLEMVHKGTRIGVELDRTPELRDRREPLDGWDELVRNLLPGHLDLPGARGERPPYETARLQIEHERQMALNVQAYKEDIDKRLGGLPPEPPRSEPMEKPGWMTTGLYDSISPFPALQQYVSNIGAVRSQSVLELFDRTVIGPLKSHIQGEVQNDTSISEKGKSKVLRDRLTAFDKQWDEKIEPGLVALRDFKEAPPMPEGRDRTTVQNHKKELVKYIESQTKVQQSIRTSYMTTWNLAGSFKEGTKARQAIDDSNKAMMQVMNQVQEQLTVAQQRLKALS